MRPIVGFPVDSTEDGLSSTDELRRAPVADRQQGARSEAMRDTVVAYSTDQFFEVVSARSAWFERSKRVLDFIFAIAAMVIFSPVLLVSAVLIKLTDFGPILFRQVRVGRGGEEFICYKFRSMVVGADEMKEHLWEQNDHKDSLTFKIRRDPRVTRVGRFLRKTSIDELPQLWNVLRGQMSIVGPRPPVPSEVEWYTQYHLRRLEVKPGLTCIWQVSGRGDVPFDEQMAQDICYIENRSIWLDMKLIAKTIPAVFSTRGAY